MNYSICKAEKDEDLLREMFLTCNSDVCSTTSF